MRSEQEIRQSLLIHKIIRFIELDSGKEMNSEQKDNLTEGLCFGLALVHSYMNAIEKLDWWKKLLIKAIEWDESELSLKKPVEIQKITHSIDERTETLSSPHTGSGPKIIETTHSAIFKIINYILYNFAHKETTGLENLASQPDFLMPEEVLQSEDNRILRFDSKQGAIKKYAIIVAPQYDNQFLRELFSNEKFFMQEAVFLVSNPTHACSIRYSESEKKWYLNDPKFPAKEKEAQSISELIDILKISLPGVLIFKVASWKAEIDLTHIYNLYTMTSIEFYVRYAIDYLDCILKMSKNDEELSKCFAQTIANTDKSGWTGLKHLSRFSERGPLSTIIQLANSNPYFSFNLALAIANITDDDNTGLHEIIIYASDHLPALIDLAKNKPEVRNKFLEALFKIKNNIDDLRHIAFNFSSKLSAIVKLAANNPEDLKVAEEAFTDRRILSVVVEKSCPEIKLSDIFKPFLKRDMSAQEKIQLISKLDQGGVLYLLIREQWKETRNRNVHGFFSCGTSDAEIMYRKIQKKYKQPQSKSRIIQVLALMKEFHSKNKEQPFSMELNNLFELDKLDLTGSQKEYHL